jgi:hypothetical protein
VPTVDGGVESIIDFDLSLALLYPQEVTLYQTQSTQTQQRMWIKEYGTAANKSVAQQFLPFIEALDGKLCTQREKQSGADCGAIDLTHVLSVSYGYSELQTPERAANRICAEFMKLALKGHTLLLASQDEGVGQKPPFDSIPRVPWTNGCKHPPFASRGTWHSIHALNGPARYQSKSHRESICQRHCLQPYLPSLLPIRDSGGCDPVGARPVYWRSRESNECPQSCRTVRTCPGAGVEEFHCLRLNLRWTNWV